MIVVLSATRTCPFLVFYRGLGAHMMATRSIPARHYVRTIRATSSPSNYRKVDRLALKFSPGWRDLFMDDDARAFNGHRPRLQKMAYRMLGSIAEARRYRAGRLAALACGPLPVHRRR
ncbi:hypothetical protein BN2476_210001 [Paraburkholderia piptadeniae]|uniref:Uncharacterized protein n=1 Tax=Paraburkholderia piptadeniae TaxID=1701573 RepID=A0A1N7RV84_9BURK|nr:hypothetical protein BN2476_210001 [Paraburkholderia piptadeniae]